MEPIPETFEALEEFGAYLYDDDLLTELGRMAARVREIVPDCVGLSLAYREHDVTFTLVATDEITAALDALQYLDDGPCVDGGGRGATPSRSARTTSSTKGAGTCSPAAPPRPLSRARSPSRSWSRRTVVGSVNLYASSPDAFDGRHQQVARALGAWPEGAIVNADLGFTTRRAAEDAPRQLFEATRIQVAVGILASSQDVSPPVARDRLREAARRAGVSETAVARLVIEQATGPRSNRASDDARRDDQA